MRSSISIFGFFILVFLFNACVQNSSSNRVDFTIDPENRTIIIPVLLNDSITANMVFDTGWNGSLTLDSLFCAINPFIDLNSPDSSFKMGSSWSPSYLSLPGSFFKTLQTIKIGDVNLTYQYLSVFNFKTYFNTDADGLLGIPYQDTTHVWELNFERNYLEIHQANRFKMPKNCYLLPFTEYLEIQIPMHIECSNGDTITFNSQYFIDTGMPQDIVLVHPTKEEIDFFYERDDAVWISSGAPGYYIRHIVRSTLFDDFIADSMRIYTLDSSRRISYKRLIGQNFLKRFNVFFDLKKGQLGLQPIKNFQRIVNQNHRRYYFSLKYSTTGQLLVDHIPDYNGNLVYEAGVRTGDEFFMINDKIRKNLTYDEGLEIAKADTLRSVFLRDGGEQIMVSTTDKYDRED